MHYCYCEASSSASVVYVVHLRMLIFSMAALYKRGVPWNPMNPSWIRHCVYYYGCEGYLTKYAGKIRTCVISPSSGKWSSPPTTGPRPPPCNHFSFTAINNHQAVLFGGRQPHGRVSDCYLMDFESMVRPEMYAGLEYTYEHTQWVGQR